VSCLVALQPGTPDAPSVLCVHPFGGSAAVYGPLAAHLGADVAVHGLQSAGLIAGREPDETVAAMADRYADEIRPVLRPGRTALVGYSMGGVVAVEIARRLASSPPVVLVDADPLHSDVADPWRILVHQVLDVDLPTEPLADLRLDEALARVRAAGAAQGRMPARMNLDRLSAMLRVCRSNARAAAAHVPLPVAGTLHIIRSGRPAGWDPWDGIAAAVVVTDVAVGHHEIMRPPGLPAVAGRIRSVLGLPAGYTAFPGRAAAPVTGRG
jgi:thioesterase domain-containing protein